MARDTETKRGKLVGETPWRLFPSCTCPAGVYDTHNFVHEDYCALGTKETKRGKMPEEPNEQPDFDPDEIMGEEALKAGAKMGLTLFRAVIRDGGTWNEAFSVTAAWFAGMNKAIMEDD